MSRMESEPVFEEYTEDPNVLDVLDQSASKGFSQLYQMLLGIRIHICKMATKGDISDDPVDGHFFECQKISICSEGLNPDAEYDFEFKAFTPIPFLLLRQAYGITDQEYLASLTSDCISSFGKSIGRSSAVFFFSWDGKFIIKTLRKYEMQTLKLIFPMYFHYIKSHPDSMINRFYGAYKVKTNGGESVSFVVMNNIFPLGIKLSYRFDIKGSVVNRKVDKKALSSPGKSTWKDFEFQSDHYIKLGPRDWSVFRDQMLNDTNFLSSCGVMDYSLICGIHKLSSTSRFLHPLPGEPVELFSVFTPNVSASFKYRRKSVMIHGQVEPFSRYDQTDQLNIARSSNRSLFAYAGGIRASSPNDEPLDEVYFLGFIDFLQNYDGRKSMEHMLKSMVYKKDEMSCIPPGRYAARMFDFLEKTMCPIPKEERARKFSFEEETTEPEPVPKKKLAQPRLIRSLMPYFQPKEYNKYVLKV